MDGWLKALIAGACIVVIAGGAYYGWSEYRLAQARKDREAVLTSQATERAKLARLTADYCNSIATSALSKVTGKDFRTLDRIADLKTCSQRSLLGYVERRELEAEGLL